jgi:cation:H+ antiporter
MLHYKPVSIILFNALLAIFGIITTTFESHLPDLLLPIIYGFAIFGAAILISWGAEASEKDISGAFVIALIALIAVLPEYSIESILAYTAGKSYKNNNFTYTDRVGYVSANVTGANRLLAGLGWPLIMLINLYRNNKQINITKNNKLELVIIFAGLASMTLTFILDMQPLIMSAILICIYLFYLYVSSKKESEEPEFVGISKYITEFRKPQRITINVTLIVFSAISIFVVSHPFVESLIHVGEKFGIDEYYLIQWLAPLASESPEILIASLFAFRNKSIESIAIILSSQANQMSLLIGSMGWIFALAAGRLDSFPVNDTQAIEFLLTAAFALFQIAIIYKSKFNKTIIIGFMILFASQLIFSNSDFKFYLSIFLFLLSIPLFSSSLIANKLKNK